MVKPTLKDLHKVNEMNQNDLRDEFKVQCEGFIGDVFSYSKPKRIGKAPINGLTYTKYLEVIIKGINENQFVSINDSIQTALNFDTEQYIIRSYKDIREL